MAFQRHRPRVLYLLGGAALLVIVVFAAQWMRNRYELRHRVFRIGFENSTISQFVGADGKPRGPAIEIVREAARRAGIRLEWVRVTVGVDRALREGLVDLWPIMAKFPEREGVIYISPPWRTQRFWLMSRAGAQAIPVRIAMIPDRPTEWAATQSKLSLPDIVRKKTMSEVIAAVCAGEADSALLPEGPSFPAYNARASICNGIELKWELAPSGSIQYGVGATLRNPLARKAASAIRTAMLSLALDETLAEIQLRWSLISANDLLVIGEYEAARRRNYELATGMLVLIFLSFAFVRQNRCLRTARRAADRALAAKESFLANMSHEIRTPMNGILGTAELLLNSSLDVEQADHVRTLHGSATCLVGILNDILDSSKLEAGKLTLEKTELDLLEVTEDVLDLFGSTAIQCGIELILDFDPRLRRQFSGDPGRLRQVLINLVGNAVKFTEHGEVIVRLGLLSETGNTRSFVRFEVEDTGIGIPADAQHDLFEKFTQADASTTRKYGGTGLGLSICHKLVALMDGRIGVTSRAGEGSRFWFEIPLDTLPGDSPAAAPQVPATVLVVSPSESLRGTLSKQLAAMGLHVISNSLPDVASGASADLIIADEAGQEALTGIWGQVPVILLSGKKPEQRAGESWIWVRKPVVWSRIESAVGQALSKCAPGDASVAAWSPERSRFHGIRVLLAEDNRVNQKVMARMLDRLGCTTEIACNGLEALDLAQAAHFGLILMDCQMPQMDGFEATRRLRQSASHASVTPIVALTASALDEHRRMCAEAGMDDYVAKPISFAKLEEILDKWTNLDRQDATVGNQIPTLHRG